MQYSLISVWLITTSQLAAMDTAQQKLGTAEEIRNTPRADPSLELLAIETTGSFTASQSVYERLEKDIAAARPILKEIRPSLAEITYRGHDDGKTLLFGADDDETFKQMVSGEYEAWQDLNDWYGVENKREIFRGLILSVRFKGIYNMKQLADIYSKLPGVKYAELDGMIGGGSTIKVKMDGDTWFYTFVENWGDCPAGCINSEEFYVTSTAPGAVRYTGSQRTRGEDSYGQEGGMGIQLA